MPESVAWLVPTHTPNFPHTDRLLRSAEQHGVQGRWIPLFGQSWEADAYYTQYPSDGVHFVVAEVIGSDRVLSATASRSIVNVKKLAALWALRSQFEVMHVIDTECIVLRGGDARRSFALREATRVWPAHGHDHPLIRGIQESTVALFDLADRRRLRDEHLTDAWLYSWFEDIPTYRAGVLDRFFDYFGAHGDVTRLTDELTWETFEHLIYQYFCCLREGWSLFDTRLPTPPVSTAAWETWRDGNLPDLDPSAQRHLARWQPSWVVDAKLVDLSPLAFVAYHQEEAPR